MVLGEVQFRRAFLDERLSVIAAVRDITEQRAMEQALRQSQKMEAVGQLTGGIAHDFNNLLAVIQGNLELIVEKIGGDAELADMTGDALAAADRGASLVRQLLAYARKQPLAPRVFRVDSVMASIAGIAQRTLGEAIEVRTIASADSWPVRADPHQLENALLNLAVNARDAMPEGGKLTLEVANKEVDEAYRVRHSDILPGRYVKICVTDTGVGIPEDILDRVLEPFFTTKASGAGTGLGLSMVYGFVKQSGGHLNIYSEVGVGTTVTLYLPAAERADDRAPTIAPHSTPVMSGAEVILVLEDDDMVRKFAVRVLASLGYRTLQAANGVEALRMLAAEGRVDLLLTDVILPNRMNGPAVAESARALGGLLDPGAQMLGKPFLKSELWAKVREILGS
jgi:signal transduction histidine kinase